MDFIFGFIIVFIDLNWIFVGIDHFFGGRFGFKPRKIRDFCDMFVWVIKRQEFHQQN